MNWWEAALLGLVQGLTEFLPISSSGHLVLAKYVLGVEAAGADNVTFEVFVHFGTVLSILTVYGQEVRGLIGKTLLAAAAPHRLPEHYRTHEEVRMVAFILLTLLPTGIVYLFFGDFLEARFSDPRFVCGMLLVTGLLLLLTLLRRHPDGPVTPWKALLIGLAQSAAMTPGISRSGATICTALYLNVTPRKAADFSFLMLLPVVLGATLIKGIELFETGLAMGWIPLVVGTLVAYGSGVAAIKLLLDVIRRGNLAYFAIYCFFAGTLGLVLI
ncbi:undecaprenyl-diphosphate phosphatase [Rhodocaloribacter litoris]|uniref:undecaprenyl-diphosphate phosphatase n=1 Tax=Rhodocaloribacter litoris TaxID=2558931 RepID=UPI001424581F|nr:undecaprenyl-diphosphate phosphatase [Rhodocaloribacter litoris]QXD16951.1 undecaprenyl-diphosphate phosphatase [Rhodocaloribacter litoris]